MCVLRTDRYDRGHILSLVYIAPIATRDVGTKLWEMNKRRNTKHFTGGRA